MNVRRINTIAKNVGWFKRNRLLGPMDLLKLMMCGQTNYQRSLTEMCQELSDRNGSISKQSLDERLNKSAAEFFKQVLGKILNLKLLTQDNTTVLKSFKGIKIIDATSFQLPENLSAQYKGSGGGATNAGIKTHYQIEITKGQQIDLQVTDAASSDTSTNLARAIKGYLQIFDLGYYSLKILKGITEACAFYLCRIKYDTQIWIKTTAGFVTLDWPKQIKAMRPGEIKELQVYLGRQKAVECRLIIEKVPIKVANEKRRKLKAEKANKRKTISKGRLDFCALNVFITNATIKQLTKENAREIYRLRWQIEIYFKTWKSYMNIDKIEKMNVHRFNCTHYGTLIYIILVSKLFFFIKHKYWKIYVLELSELKAFKLLSKRSQMIWDIIFAHYKLARSELIKLTDNMLNNCIKEQKYNKLLPYESIVYALT